MSEKNEKIPPYQGSGKGELGGDEPLWKTILKLPFQVAWGIVRGTKIPKD